MPAVSKIDWPICDSEFEVQAELYFMLRVKGLKVRGCVFGYGDEPVSGGFTCFLDLVVFDSKQQPRVIIECKNQRKDTGNGSVVFRRKTRQGRRYQAFKLPVFQCVCMAQVPTTYNAVIEYLNRGGF